MDQGLTFGLPMAKPFVHKKLREPSNLRLPGQYSTRKSFFNRKCLQIYIRLLNNAPCTKPECPQTYRK
jgi:hypothetical protein